MPTLRQLRYLVALADQGHFGRAASACAVSQPALSQQIADLEARLGIDLVDRRGRGAALTETGVLIVARARAILSSVQDLTRAAVGTDALIGTVSLGVIPTIAPYLLPTVLPALHAAFPEARFAIREAVSATLINELRAGELDLILLALPIAGDDLETLPLFEDVFHLATARADAPDGPMHPAQLNLASLLLLDEGHCLRDQALSLCGTTDPGLRTQLGATSLATLVQLVAAGHGQTLIPDMALPALTDPRIAITPFARPSPSRTVGLAYRTTSSRKGAFARLGEVLRCRV